MKRLFMLSLLVFLMLVIMPFSSFAMTPATVAWTDGSSILIEKSIKENPNSISSKSSLKPDKPDANSDSSVTTQEAGGYGTISCKAIGFGKMSCNWSVTLTKSGEAIQSLYMIFEVKNSNGDIVGTKEVYKQPLGGNGKTYRDQIDFNPGPGDFTVTKYGSVEGRYAVYGVAPIKAASVTVY